MLAAAEYNLSNCSSRSSETSSPNGLSPSSSSNVSSAGIMSSHQQPFYFGNNNYHQAFQSEKSKYSEEDARWFDAFNYFRAIKPEPLELNPSFQSYPNTPAHFYQQQYQNGFGSTTTPQFYFHTQNIIQNNINNRVQNIFANDATIHQDDNNTLVNLGQFPVHTSMESRSQVDSYYYSSSSAGGNATPTTRHGLSQPSKEDDDAPKRDSHSTDKDLKDKPSDDKKFDDPPKTGEIGKTCDDTKMSD